MTDKLNEGLSIAEAEERLKKDGKNVFDESRKKSALGILLMQFKDVIIIMLIIGAVISLCLGETADSIVIMTIVVMNGILGFVQEYRTERSLEALKELSAPVCRVIRSGEEREIAAEKIVCGDIILLGSGDRIPADCKILSKGAVNVNEAVLTGESVPVNKDFGDSLYMGTGLCSGRCRCVVTATGMKTKMGSVAGMLGGGENDTPLKKRLNKIGEILVGISIAMCILIACAGIYYGQPLKSVFFSAVSLAVAAIPEGLPAAVTLCLAIGVGKMLKRNALIRRLPAVETLGCTTVICTDKTGTLTANKMTAVNFFADGTERARLGGGEAFEKLREIAAMCLEEDVEQNSADPTERAILHAVGERNIKDLKKIGEVPFSSERKAMSVVYEKNGRYIIAVKGAPDRILKKCTMVFEGGIERKMSGEMRQRIERETENTANRALRVIAFAYKTSSDALKAEQREESELVFVGLMGLADPPRPEVREAVEKCYRAGIRPVMITGDHKATAIEIAKQVGIRLQEKGAMTGEEIDAATDRELEKRIQTVSVFARVSPEHKLRVVKALKNMGNVVAMTGDGVNDAPAMKEADIGIAMGKSGTEVAKEAATVVLTDDNFATIVSAVEEGRTIYANIRKFIRYLLSCNLGEILLMGCCAFMGLPVPLLPIQILWVNLVTDGLPALALGMCPGEKNAMKSPPRNPRESIFSGGMGTGVALSGLIMGGSSLIAFVAGYRIFGSIELGRTACFAVLITAELIFAVECRNEKEKISIFANKYLLAAVALSFVLMLAVIYNPFLASLFSVAVPNTKMWFMIFCLSAVEPIIGRLAKSGKGKVIKAKSKA